MEMWQILYLVVVGVGFGVGWLASPIVAVGFVWLCIIVFEVLNYREEVREFERRSEEA